MTRADATKDRIVDALDKLLCNKTLEDVTVLEVCHEAGIGKSTFYRHFDDISCVLAYYFERVVLEETESVRAHGGNVSCFEASEAILRRLVSKRNLYLGSVTSRNFGPVAEKVAAIGDKCYEDFIGQTDHRSLSAEEGVLLQYYGFAVTMAIVKWMNDGMPFGVDRLVEIMRQCYPRALEEYGEISLLGPAAEKGA